MASVVAGGKVAIPLLVREVLKIREGDYVHISSNVSHQKETAEEGFEEEGIIVILWLFSLLARVWIGQIGMCSLRRVRLRL